MTIKNALPCPFCGKSDLSYETLAGTDIDERGYRDTPMGTGIICNTPKCGSCGPVAVLEGGQETKEKRLALKL